MWKIRNCAETCGRSFCLQVVPVDWFFFLFDYKVFFTISKYAYNNRGWIRIRNSLNSGFTTLINSLNWLMLLSGKSVGRVFLEQTSLISVQKVFPFPPPPPVWKFGHMATVGKLSRENLYWQRLLPFIKLFIFSSMWKLVEFYPVSLEID